MAPRGAALAAALLCGCAPLAVLRPPGELSERQRTAELGAAVVGFGPRKYVTEAWETTAQVWGTWAFGPAAQVSTVAAFDDSGGAGGLAFRWTPLRPHPLVMGGEVEAGFGWAAVSLPVGIHVLEPLWIYTAPRLSNLGLSPAFGFPSGLSLETLPGLILRGEIQLSWADFLAYQRRVHLAAGIAYQW